jgi:hypothetical protein
VFGFAGIIVYCSLLCYSIGAEVALFSLLKKDLDESMQQMLLKVEFFLGLLLNLKKFYT